MKISEEIKKALEIKKPIVALESTIISHGMPYPQNVEVAVAVEQTVRNEDVVPATIAIINGEIIVGLDRAQIEYIGSAKNVMKLSTREVPLCMALRKDGATTVSATAFIAEMVGIKVFATGGAGGVHRDVIDSFDISRDLEELSARNIILVSSGAKSILDIPKTLEYLETKGVLVLGYKSDNFPVFYSNDSAIKIPIVNNASEVADIFKNKEKLAINGAILVANPIPDEFAIPADKVEQWLSIALNEAKINNIHGKNVTPFLLSKLFELSGGKTLYANIHLVNNNAKVASMIAKELIK
jgi:pseudouridine-5'-phosphate glycosidase